MKTAAFALAAYSPFAAVLSQPLQSPPSLKMGLPPSWPCVGSCSGPCIQQQFMAKWDRCWGPHAPEKGPHF